MTNYQVTIGYKAVITISIKAESEIEAKKQAIDKMIKQRDKMFLDKSVDLQDDTIKANGVLNLDETWNML